MVVSSTGVARRATLKTTPRRVERALASRRWLVLAPHPDDETLAAGALLAATARDGHGARVVYLTDGAASHPGSASFPRRRLAALRRREARAALRRLCGAGALAPLFLDWPDATPHASGSAAFDRSLRALVNVIRRDRVDALATTWSGEPHCDHAAAAALAKAAAARCFGRLQLYWSVVWGWETPEMACLVEGPVLPLGHGAARRKSALGRHRSQVGAVVTDSPDGFSLPAGLVRRAGDPQVLFGPYRG